MTLPPFNPPPLPYQSKQTRDWLSLFGPYLAHQLLVFSPARNRYGLLCGLPCVNVGQERPWADVLLFGTEKEAQRTITVDFAEPVCNILPVLRSFEDLATPLIDGTIPADILGANFPSFYGGDPMSVELFTGDDPKYNYLVFTDIHGDKEMIWKDAFESASEAPFTNSICDALRKLHFAVGLLPNQYHRMPQQVPAAA